MLVCMDPSSPPVKRTLHLLKTPDILLANDSRLLGSYNFGNTSLRMLLNQELPLGGHSSGTAPKPWKAFGEADLRRLVQC